MLDVTVFPAPLSPVMTNLMKDPVLSKKTQKKYNEMFFKPLVLLLVDHGVVGVIGHGEGVGRVVELGGVSIAVHLP